MLESLFNKVADLQACNFIKKRLLHRFFCVNLRMAAPEFRGCYPAYPIQKKLPKCLQSNHLFWHVISLFYISNTFFSTQCQCCLTFSWNELQMLLRCRLVQISTIMRTYVLYLVYLYVVCFLFFVSFSL